MIERSSCIFCSLPLKQTFFENDLENFTGHYAVDLSETNFVKIPYNIYICDSCNTPQLKYLGDPKEVYRINHADSTGKVMRDLHEEVLKLIEKYKNNVYGVIEIGGAKGILADKLLSKLNIPYTIIDPAYFGSDDKKTIVRNFYENVDDATIDGNTVIMSHVFEHFYRPLEILEKISVNEKIQNLFLVFPNLEAYLTKDILHVLNVEHTFYADNHFLECLFMRHGFAVKDKIFYDDHSVIFHFQRAKPRTVALNNKHNLMPFFDRINRIVTTFNEVIDGHPEGVYLFPASIHSIFLTIMGLKYQGLTAMLDNSELKIGKKMYGLEVPICDFKPVLKDKNSLVLLSGGVFNKEVEHLLENNGIKCIS